jgi:hypothetical protein
VKEETLLDVTIEKLLYETLADDQYQGTRISVLELAFLSQAVDADVDAVCTPEASCLGYYEAGELLQRPSRFAEQRRLLEYCADHAMNLFV